MVFAMATTVSAATDRIVGVNPPAGNTYEDGWTDAQYDANGTVANPISISVSAGSTQSRYAVDVTYEAIVVEITAAGLTWDVNKLEYVITGDGTMTQPTDKTITVTNYSDQPVYVSAVVTDLYDGITNPEDGMTITATVDGGATLAKAFAKSGSTPGSATTKTITVSFSAAGDNWAAVSNFYSGVLSSSNPTAEIAQVNVAISKTAP